MLKVSLFMIRLCSGPVSLAVDHADSADLLDTECFACHRSPHDLSRYVIRVGLLTHDVVQAGDALWADSSRERSRARRDYG